MADTYALVTGATSGIGLEFARLLAEDGYDLVLVARGKRTLIATKNILEREFDVKVVCIAQDLTRDGAAERIFNAVVKRKMIVDVLVNNAGFGLFGKFSQTDRRKELAMIQLNVVALTELTKLMVPDMLKRGNGKIVHLASIAAFFPGPLMAVYYATKAYVLSFSEALAKELQGTGVTVTALCPGPTYSGFQTASELGGSRLLKNAKFSSSQDVAKYGYTAMNAGQVVAVEGLMNRMLVLLVRFIPRDLVSTLVYHYQKFDKH